MDPQSLLAASKCFVCLGVLEGDALELALLDQIATASASTLTLSFVVGGLGWVWNGPNPDHWDIQYSPDGSTGWSTVFTEPGTSRGRDIDDGDIFIRVVGADAGDNPITPFSNVLFSP